jgi:hypothetical protein
MLSVFPQWGFTFIYIRLVTSNDVSIGTIGPTSITQNIINNYHINYLLILLLSFIINHIKVGPTCTLYITIRVTGRSDS